MPNDKQIIIQAIYYQTSDKENLDGGKKYYQDCASGYSLKRAQKNDVVITSGSIGDPSRLPNRGLEMCRTLRFQSAEGWTGNESNQRPHREIAANVVDYTADEIADNDAFAGAS